MTTTPRHRAVIDERPELADQGTQIANPRRAALRTIVESLLPLLVIVNASAVAVVGYLNEQTDLAIPGSVFGVLNAIVVGTALVIGLVARLMAVPGVDAWFGRVLPALAALRRS